MALNSNIPSINLDESLTHQYMLYDPNTRRSAISETTRYSGTGTFVVADNIPYREAIDTLRNPQTYTPVWFGNADYTLADPSSIILGDRAGAAVTAVGTNNIAIGVMAGQNGQGGESVAIGTNAGTTGEGAGAIAIGANAGSLNQAANSIVIAADGVGENTVPSSCVIKPIRNVPDQTGLANLHYNPTTSEVSWGVETFTSFYFEHALEGNAVTPFVFDAPEGYQITSYTGPQPLVFTISYTIDPPPIIMTPTNLTINIRNYGAGYHGYFSILRPTLIADHRLEERGCRLVHVVRLPPVPAHVRNHVVAVMCTIRLGLRIYTIIQVNDMSLKDDARCSIKNPFLC